MGESLSRDCVYVVHEPGHGDVAYFKRISSPLLSDHEAMLRGEWTGSWDVVRQTGTLRVVLNGPNAHRKVAGTFTTEGAADAFMRLRGVGK